MKLTGVQRKSYEACRDELFKAERRDLIGFKKNDMTQAKK